MQQFALNEGQLLSLLQKYDGFNFAPELVKKFLKSKKPLELIWDRGNWDETVIVFDNKWQGEPIKIFIQKETK